MASGKASDSLGTLQIDGFNFAHPVTGMRVRGSLMVDEGSSTTVVVARGSRWAWDRKHHAQGNVRLCAATLCSPLWAPSAHLNCSNILQDWAAVRGIQWDLSLGEARWRTGKVEATIDLVETAGWRMAMQHVPFQNCLRWHPRPTTRCSRTQDRAPTLSSWVGLFGQYPGRRPSAAGTRNDNLMQRHRPIGLSCPRKRSSAVRAL